MIKDVTKLSYDSQIEEIATLLNVTKDEVDIMIDTYEKSGGPVQMFMSNVLYHGYVKARVPREDINEIAGVHDHISDIVDRL